MTCLFDYACATARLLPRTHYEGLIMGYGLGIFLIVVGAILKFAVADRVSGIDLSMIGWILMGTGVLALILGIVQQAQRSNTTHRHIVDRHETVDRNDHVDGV